MKLAKKINYIILPILSAIFIIAGVISYYSQKSIVSESLNNKMEYNAYYILSSIWNNLAELDSLTKQFLNNSNVAKHLNHNDSIFETYSIERQLIRFISHITIANEHDIRLKLTDSDSNTVFFYDSQNPFAQPKHDEGIERHIFLFKNQLVAGHSSTINPTQYQIEPISQNEILLSVYRTFSPEQSIYDNVFSYHSRLYTAKLSMTINVTDAYLPTITSAFGKLTTLDITPSGQLVDSSHLNKITFMSQELGHLKATSPFGNVTIELSPSAINSLLLPYMVAIASLVLNVTFICFYLLRKLIKKQVISPVESLSIRVEKAIEGDEHALTHLDSDDEVSSLNNNYIRLLEDLNSLARRDSLTGLANRSVFSSSLIRCIDDAITNSKRCALFFIDLDNFKHINDSHGHQVGDMLLIEFSKILTSCFRQEDMIVKPNLYSNIARIAGDEFAVILPNAPSIEVVSSIAQRVLDACKSGINTENIHHDIQVSIGISISPDDALDADDLMQRADAAMYEVKRNGKNDYQFYSPSMEDELKRFKLIAENLRQAIHHEQFHLLFMPIYNCQSRKIDGIEALIRSTNNVLKTTGPDEYIPIAESNGLIRWIDLWVINNAFEHLNHLIECYNFSGFMSVNISSWQLRNEQFVSELSRLIEKHNVPVNQIELEITETCLVNNDKRVIQHLQDIKTLGVKLSLDDFGTGYTAFNQLQHYPVDTLKIDRTFIAAINNDKTHQRPLVDIIIELASLYHLNVIAEGIETESQLAYVTKLGCQGAQGYFFSKPISWKELAVILSAEDPSKHS